MATPKQIAANRRNAQKSRGPVSPAGKEKISQNRAVHGLRGTKFSVLPEVESQEQYDAYVRQLIHDEAPVGQAEIELVIKMAEHSWLAKRALHMQNLCFVLEPKTPEQDQSEEIPVGIDAQLERWVRYHAAQDRAYQRASADLQKRKKERRLAEIGFESQKRAHAQEIRKAERHAVAVENENLKKQHREIRNAEALARILPPDLNLSTANVAVPRLGSHSAMSRIARS
jgi:hypothetical protein